MRARSNSACTIPVEIEEAHSSDQEVVSTRSDDTSRARHSQTIVNVARHADDERIVDLSHVIAVL